MFKTVFWYNLKITEQHYNNAIDLYSKAIEKNPNSAVLYANRSIANLRLENFGYALIDASKAIDLDRGYTKAYYRRAAAYMSLGKYKLALKDFEYVSNPIIIIYLGPSFFLYSPDSH